MANKLRGFRALGIVGFAALTVSLVSACNGNGTFTVTANDSGSATTGAAATTTPNSGSGTGSGYSGATTTTPAAGAPTTAPAADTRRCLPANLTFSLGNNSQNAQNLSQDTQVVDMTNHTSATCTMDGFPGVDLIGDTDTQPSYDWTLVNSSTPAAKVTLRPGATAHFDIVYLSGDLASGGGDKNVLAVQRMVITTPGQPDKGDNTVQGSLGWAGSVVLQDGATHPGTYLTPVAAGS